jgi:hypothetical protein
MKLTSTLRTFGTPFLKSLTRWCRDEVGLPAGQLKAAHFGRRTRGGRYAGRAYWYEGRISVRIYEEGVTYPFDGHSRGSSAITFRCEDAVELLVKVTAHELVHLAQWHQGRGGIQKLTRSRSFEHSTQAEAVRILGLFKGKKAELLAQWAAAQPERAKPAVPLQDKRRAAVEKRLAEWKRKLKLAHTKVKKYGAKLRYYERAAASRPGVASP